MSETINLIQFYKKFPDEKACRDFLQQARWGSNKTCPKCGVMGGKIYKLKDTRLLKCATCRQPFSVRVGSVFEDSAISLQSWFLAIYLSTSLKKGISSVQLAKYLGITQKSAWHMLHRIRHNETGAVGDPLSDIVEVDETYVGGKHRQKGVHDNKMAVIGAVEKKKDGRIKTTVTKTADATIALPFIKASVKAKASIQTDESKIYYRLKRDFNHEFVTHKADEYVRGGVSTNTIDGAWDHLKLGLKAIYMGVSPKHLGKYCDEFAYRYNTRGLTDGQRFEEWFKTVNGKKLTYKKLIS